MPESNADVKAQVTYRDASVPGYRWMQVASLQMLAQNVAAPLCTRGMALVSVFDQRFDDCRVGFEICPESVLTECHRFDYPASRRSNRKPLLSFGTRRCCGRCFRRNVLPIPAAVAETYSDMAEEAARSRVYAGACFPSDINADLQLSGFGCYSLAGLSQTQ